MEENTKKKQIIIEVDPQRAVVTMGLVKLFLPSIVDFMKTKLEDVSLFDNSDGDNEQLMYDVINEIYEKCIAETNIRENAAKYIDLLKATGGQFPDGTIN